RSGARTDAPRRSAREPARGPRPEVPSRAPLPRDRGRDGSLRRQRRVPDPHGSPDAARPPDEGRPPRRGRCAVSEKNDFTNDPRLPAYALGELEGAERAEIEALVAKDEAARRAVDEIRATAAAVIAELGGVGAAKLTADQRASVAAKADAARPVFRM